MVMVVGRVSTAIISDLCLPMVIMTSLMVALAHNDLSGVVSVHKHDETFYEGRTKTSILALVHIATRFVVLSMLLVNDHIDFCYLLIST